jgi:hypothetical protein
MEKLKGGDKGECRHSLFYTGAQLANRRGGREVESHAPSISVADPELGSGAFLSPGSGISKKTGSGINNPDHIFDTLETNFWVKILKFLDADPEWKKFGSGIRNPRWTNFGSGFRNP